jgi:glutaredoxin
MFCRRTEEFLRAKGVEYTAKNVADDEKAFAELGRMGTMATPVTVIGGEEIVVGFDRKELERLLSGKREEDGF